MSFITRLIFNRYDEALQFLLKSVEIRLIIFGETHPKVAVSYNNVGVVYRNIGQYVKFGYPFACIFFNHRFVGMTKPSTTTIKTSKFDC